MTIKADLQAKLAEIDAKWTAERAPIRAELDTAGSWLEQEAAEFEAWAKGIMDKVRGIPPAAP